MSTPLDVAESFEAELSNKLSRAREALERNKQERLALAFAAESGDDAAKKTVYASPSYD